MKARAFVAVVGALTIVLCTAGSAWAGIGISTSLTMPPTTVGMTGETGSFTIRNTNTPPNNTESNSITQMRLAAACGAAGSVANLCGVPELGVISIGSTALGRVGTACAGVTFNVSAPDGIGAVVFTKQGGGSVVLAPPGGANECTVDFTFSVLKSPAVDVSVTAGVQTFTNFLGSTQGMVSGITVNSAPSATITINKAAPDVAVQAAQNVLTDTISATATIAGPPGVPAAAGTVTFTAYGPNDVGCTGAVLGTSTNAVTGSAATSNDFAVSLPGTYRFKAVYNGDANYTALTMACNSSNGNVPVGPRAVADFDGNNTTDFGVFRNGGWYVHAQATTFLGLAGHIPVPADYDGDGDSDRATFNNGAWYVQDQPTVYFGLTGNIPVPGDYDGDGIAERAVYVPATGGWYVEGMSPVFLGLSGDIPVPGDYNGDGDTERAVYRNGGWYVEGQAAVFLGLSGDVPVPGDYDGDGDTDRAVFRNGTWYVHNQATVAFGLTADVPVPGDYNGNGTTDRAVFRTGTWYVQSQSTVFHGQAGDLPLPLPQAIYRATFGM